MSRSNKRDPRCPKCGAGLPGEVCQECGHVPLDDELEELRAKANKLRYKRCTDGAPGYVVRLGEDIIGVVWYARECGCWYANPDPSGTRPSHTQGLGSFPKRDKAGEGLRKRWGAAQKNRYLDIEIAARKEKVSHLRLELRHRIEHAEILERAAMLVDFPNRWLSEPYNKAIARMINLDFSLHQYGKGAECKTAMRREIRAALKDIKKHFREGADRMASWTGDDRL